MREIKFRAWDSVHKCFDYVVAANLLSQLHNEDEDIDAEYGTRFILSQFTGIWDSNNTPIFEGDIVLIPLYGHTIIIWNEDIAAFQYAYKAIGKGTAIDNRMTNTLFKHEKNKYQVVGNIYAGFTPTHPHV
jgi:hypothetical protein